MQLIYIISNPLREFECVGERTHCRRQKEDFWKNIYCRRLFLVFWSLLSQEWGRETNSFIHDTNRLTLLSQWPNGSRETASVGSIAHCTSHCNLCSTIQEKHKFWRKPLVYQMNVECFW